VKLLYVIHQFFPDCRSGTEQYCLALAQEARRQGDQVTILSLDGVAEHEPPEPIKVEDRPYDGFSVLRMRLWAGLVPDPNLRDYQNPQAAARFAEIVAELKPDAIHFFHLRNLGSDFLTRAKAMGQRCLVHLMDFWYLCPRFTLLTSSGELCSGPPDGGRGCIACHDPEAADPEILLGRKATQLQRLSQADGIFAPSRFLAETFAANGLPEDRMQVLPYGLEAGRIQVSQTERPRHPMRIGFAGVFSPWKGARILVDAVRSLDGDLRLSLHGNDQETMFLDYIADLRAAAGDDPRIHFAGPYEPARVGKVMADLDLLVVPSLWYENSPFVILEAFAAGLPVVASALGGMTEIVQEGVDGFTFPPGDSQALCGILKSLLDEPKRVADLKPSRPPSISQNYAQIRRCYG
jgi:glycosyltransferase involved in cell wall biosynthesis